MTQAEKVARNDSSPRRPLFRSYFVNQIASMDGRWRSARLWARLALGFGALLTTMVAVRVGHAQRPTSHKVQVAHAGAAVEVGRAADCAAVKDACTQLAPAGADAGPWQLHSQ